MLRLLSVGLVSALFTCGAVHAEVHLAALLSDHAVLQRGRPIHVWGVAAPGEHVIVSFHGQSAATDATPTGDWEIWLSPEQAGGPYEMQITGSQTHTPLKCEDILVGDVWFASGQSNMEFPLQGFPTAPLKDGAQEIAAADHPQIRLLIQKRRSSPVLESESDDTWMVSTPETAKNFSAVAYFFGREINAREHVPIGLIDATWGGTPAQAWISWQGIATSRLDSIAFDAAQVTVDQGRYDDLRARLSPDEMKALTARSSKVRIPGNHGTSWLPAFLYNGMVAPYTKYPIKGVLWYQGETDTTVLRAPNYERVFSALIRDWRRQWGEGNFPFLFVQISSCNRRDEDWGTVRDNQRRTLQMANTGMAVTLDVGDPSNIHPPDKQSVAHRLALLAERNTYGEQVDAESPNFLMAVPEDGKMRVWFARAEGLHGPSHPSDFEVAGADHKFVPAQAVLTQDGAVVQSPEVPDPRYVRYGWGNVVTSWIYNAAGLPLGTFTSEP